jgi:hypothetical protein
MAGNRRSRRGRPPESLETVRSHRVVSYLTIAEFRALSLVADREGKSLSAVVHEILISAVEGLKPESTPRR